MVCATITCSLWGHKQIAVWFCFFWTRVSVEKESYQSFPEGCQAIGLWIKLVLLVVWNNNNDDNSQPGQRCCLPWLCLLLFFLSNISIDLCGWMEVFWRSLYSLQLNGYRTCRTTKIQNVIIKAVSAWSSAVRVFMKSYFCQVDGRVPHDTTS